MMRRVIKIKATHLRNAPAHGCRPRSNVSEEESALTARTNIEVNAAASSPEVPPGREGEVLLLLHLPTGDDDALVLMGDDILCLVLPSFSTHSPRGEGEGRTKQNPYFFSPPASPPLPPLVGVELLLDDNDRS